MLRVPPRSYPLPPISQEIVDFRGFCERVQSLAPCHVRAVEAFLIIKHSHQLLDPDELLKFRKSIQTLAKITPLGLSIDVYRERPSDAPPIYQTLISVEGSPQRRSAYVQRDEATGKLVEIPADQLAPIVQFIYDNQSDFFSIVRDPKKV